MGGGRAGKYSRLDSASIARDRVHFAGGLDGWLDDERGMGTIFVLLGEREGERRWGGGGVRRESWLR